MQNSDDTVSQLRDKSSAVEAAYSRWLKTQDCAEAERGYRDAQRELIRVIRALRHIE